MSKIVAVRRDEEGRITDYKLDDGKVLNTQDAIFAVDEGQIEGCMAFETRNGDMAIRSKRGQDNYKLDELPEF